MTLQHVVDLIREHHGLNLVPAGTFTGGEVGANDMRGDDGSRYVLKWWEGDAASGRRAAELVARLRQRGYPIPRFVLAADMGGVTVMLQEYVEGETSDEVSMAAVNELLALNTLQVDGAAESRNDWTDYVVGSLVRGCEGYCLHEPLRGYDARTAALLQTIQRASDGVAALRSDDIVHVDFHHRNVLWQGGRLCAVIDWEGCRTGDAAFDLVTLWFGLSVARVPPEGRRQIWDEVRRRTTPAVRRAYAAHMALRQVDWSIRHRPPEHVDHWLGVASHALQAP